jgi:cytidine deaminase
MDTGAFYSTATEYAEKIKSEKPNYVSDSGSAICLIKTDREQIFSGVTGIMFNGESIETVDAEYAAIMSMRIAGQSRAVQMITVLFEDLSVAKPGEDCLKLLLAANDENSSCEVAVSAEESVAADSLFENKPSDFMDFFMGFGNDSEAAAFDGNEDIFNVTGSSDDSENEEEAEETAESESVEEASSEALGTKAEYSDGVSIDETGRCR